MKRGLSIALMALLVAGYAQGFQVVRFESEWGTPGSDAGPFHGPSGIALDSAGNLFVADAESHRVLIVGADGKVIRALGSRGKQPGQFDSPSGIALDREGLIYVADTGNDRIQVLDPSGAPLYVFGTGGHSPKEFDEPRGLTVFSDLLFVADSGNHRVQVFSRDAVFLLAFGNEQTMQKPVDVAVGADGRMFVADETGHRIQVYGFEGGLKRTMSAPSDAPENLQRPAAVEVDERGFLFVADAENFKMKKFDPSYKVVASVGSKAKTGAGAFNEMAGLAVDPDGRVYVADAKKNTIQTFSTEREQGLPLATRVFPFSVEVEETQPGAVLDRAPLEDGSEFVLEAGSRKAYVKGADGARLDLGLFKEPASLGADRSGSLWVVDAGAHQLIKFGRDGARLLAVGKKGSAGGYLDSPRSMAFSTNGNLYVADTGNHRIQIFTPEGLLVGSFGRKGETPGMLKDPVSVALDESNNVYVAEEGNARASRFDEQGKLLGVIGGRGTAPGQFQKPGALVWSPSGHLLVYDEGMQRIQMFTAEGEFVSQFGSAGKGRGEYQAANALRAPSPTSLWVMDPERGDTQKLRLRFTPRTPSRVAVKGVLKGIELSWESVLEPYVESYKVHRRENPRLPFEAAASLTEREWTDRDVVKDRTYEYAVSSVARDGFESPRSKSASATPLKLVPQAPSGLKLEPRELAMVVSWQPNPEKFVETYTVYRSETPIGEYQEVARQPTTVALDRNLVEDRVYYYRVTATAKDGEEGPSSTVVFDRPLRSPVSKPPLQVTHIELRPVFASQYKLYEKEPLGRVTIRNNTDLPIPNARLSLSVKDYADFPTQIAFQEIPPLGSEERNVTMVFNNKVLDLTESTTLQLSFALSYFEGRMERAVSDTYPVTVYEKHALTWDDPLKAAAFVTSGDPVAGAFARAAIAELPESAYGMPDNILKAKTIFETAGLYGVKYVVDPNTPYKETSQNKARIDFVQFPRETLQVKAGDCDDLSTLFASLLENVGVTTTLLDAPGHIFLMFESGLSAAEAADAGFILDDFIPCGSFTPAIHDSRFTIDDSPLCVPLEITLIGSSFREAWKKGLAEHDEWSKDGRIGRLDVHAGWERYKPASLPPLEFKPPKVSAARIEKEFPNELRAIALSHIERSGAEWNRKLEATPDDPEALNRLAILHAEFGLPAEAEKLLARLLAKDAGNADANNNLGNLKFMSKDFKAAAELYAKAAATDPADAALLANLARAQFKIGDLKQAKETLAKALASDAGLIDMYPDLAQIQR